MDWRFEIKFVTSPDKENELLHWMGSKAGLRKCFPGRTVNSLYLDTPDYRTACDNLDGIPQRKKYRIRWYNSEWPSSESPATFEIKIRNGKLGRKLNSRLDCSLDKIMYSDIQSRECIAYGAMSLRNNLPFDNILKPSLLVSYNREYYTFANDIRMTIDKHLSFSSPPENEVQKIEKLKTEIIVLEFKFPGNEHNSASEIMLDLPFTAFRNSKYLLGLSRLGKAIYI